MTIIKPDAAFQAELQKLGIVLAEDWEKRAGADGTKVLNEFRK